MKYVGIPKSWLRSYVPERPPAGREIPIRIAVVCRSASIFQSWAREHLAASSIDAQVTDVYVPGIRFQYVPASEVDRLRGSRFACAIRLDLTKVSDHFADTLTMVLAQ